MPGAYTGLDQRKRLIAGEGVLRHFGTVWCAAGAVADCGEVA
ncbi:hypothetical protein FTUN_5623 [Frigoriglobus tundricola]|uniref:Uncharacterized protein n=1 Tax=Frigoriglobus tundricola TaxID=2774151 RepID=A0A6M5YXV8_9BACT|nr:hypothetical protein FTUN_5623 [Frigoriglobus tundricola]